MISSEEEKELVYDWKLDIPIGEYLAKATVIYGEGALGLEKKFNVGSKEFELQEIRIASFGLGSSEILIFIRVLLVVPGRGTYSSPPLGLRHRYTLVFIRIGCVIILSLAWRVAIRRTLPNQTRWGQWEQRWVW